jgi:hypothetical protein
MRMQAAYRCGDSHGVTVPWRRYTSREEALAAFLSQARRHFAFPVFGSSKEQKQTQRRMLAMLDDVTAGFKEPEVEIKEEKPEEPVRTQVEKVKERGLVQRELF